MLYDNDLEGILTNYRKVKKTSNISIFSTHNCMLYDNDLEGILTNYRKVKKT